MRTIGLHSFALATFLLTSSFLTLISIVPGTADAYTTHDPICIVGNGEFTNASGVTWGSGTATDPYIIEGWGVTDNASRENGIFIRDASVHFIIRGVLAGYCSAGAGIALVNCTNGSIVESWVTGCSCGILVEHSDNAVLTDNDVISNSQYGAKINDSDFCKIVGNSFWGTTTGAGIELACCNDFNISQNDCYENKYFGMECTLCIGGLIWNNTLYGEGIGICFDNSTSIGIDSNSIRGLNATDYYGIYLYNSSYCTASANEIRNYSQYGMLLLASSNCFIFHNDFINNSEGASNTQGTNNHFDNGYPSGGNYWSDYTGGDDYHGALQNLAGADGIGDTVYHLSSYPAYPGQDNYPLIEPYGSAMPPSDTNPNMIVTVMIAIGEKSEFGWFNPRPAIYLSAAETGGFVNKTYYRYTGTSAWSVYSGPITVNRDGYVSIQYYSTDIAGNVEAVGTGDFLVDSTPPEYLEADWNDGDSFAPDENHMVKLSWEGWDYESGIYRYQYRLDGGALTNTSAQFAYLYGLATGYHWMYINAIDGGGNAINISLGFNVTSSPSVIPVLTVELSDEIVNQGSYLTVDGLITDQNGFPIANKYVYITLEDPHGVEVIQSLTRWTGGTGHFSGDLYIPADLAPGTYNVHVTTFEYDASWVGVVEVRGLETGIATWVAAVLLLTLAITVISVAIALVVSARRKLPPR